MSIRPNRVYNYVANEFSAINFEVTENTADVIRFKANITAKKYFSDDVLLRVVSYKSGTYHVFFTFDQLDKNLRSYEAINEFNDNVSFFQGYISEKKGGDFFELHASSIVEASEDEIGDAICYIINQLLDDDVLKYLQPITKLTY